MTTERVGIIRPFRVKEFEGGAAIRPAVWLMDGNDEYIAEIAVGYTVAERRRYGRALSDAINAVGDAPGTEALEEVLSSLEILAADAPMEAEHGHMGEANRLEGIAFACAVIREALRAASPGTLEAASRQAPKVEPGAPGTEALREMKRWVDDLQSGMYVNCVYCGHRYGPGETTPVSMADALKEHVERCPKHPMSLLRRSVESALGDMGEMLDIPPNGHGFHEGIDYCVERLRLALRDVSRREVPHG
jgi:hypothetical protein